jgi:hypothetical protein
MRFIVNESFNEEAVISTMIVIAMKKGNDFRYRGIDACKNRVIDANRHMISISSAGKFIRR